MPSPPASVSQKTIRLQKRIFRALQGEVQVLLGKTPASIRQYEKENQRDFKASRLIPLTKTELIKYVRKADVTFIADFHTFDQSQRTALRILREAYREEKRLFTWYIGLELIPSQFQKELDEYQAGQLPLDSFHQLISYDSEWGFPWKNYLPIFEWARENKVRLIALNRPKAFFPLPENQELYKRDQWAAGVITDLFAEHRHSLSELSPAKMVVLYGELHVGSRHLPDSLARISKKYLKKRLDSITLHQNEEKIFWKLAQKSQTFHTQVVRLKPNVFCVLSSPPWLKLQSLVNFLEGEIDFKKPTPSLADLEASSDEEEENELETHEPDYLSIFSSYGKVISDFLEIAPTSYEALTLCTFTQIDRFDSIDTQKFSPQEFKLIRFHIENNQRFYIPRIHMAYLAFPSLNGLAELAAIHLLKSNEKRATDSTFLIQTEEDFFRWTLEVAFGFLGSLILNHRRKCDLPADHRKRLKKLNQLARTPSAGIQDEFTFPQEVEARKLTLKILQKSPAYAGKGFLEKYRKNFHIPTLVMAAQWVGQILGLKLHRALLDEKLNKNSEKNSINLPTLRTVFFPEKSHFSLFTERYFFLAQSVSRVKTPRTKTDTL